MRNLNEWELRQIQLELQQLDEDYLEFNNFFESEAFNFSEEIFDECATDLASEETSVVDFDYQEIELLSSIDAVDESNSEQFLIY